MISKLRMLFASTEMCVGFYEPGGTTDYRGTGLYHHIHVPCNISITKVGLTHTECAIHVHIVYVEEVQPLPSSPRCIPVIPLIKVKKLQVIPIRHEPQKKQNSSGPPKT